MGADLFDSRADLLAGVSDRILGWSLRDVCTEGPQELLTATDRAQPALYALAFVLWSELPPACAGRLSRRPGIPSASTRRSPRRVCSPSRRV